MNHCTLELCFTYGLQYLRILIADRSVRYLMISNIDLFSLHYSLLSIRVIHLLKHFMFLKDVELCRYIYVSFLKDQFYYFYCIQPFNFVGGTFALPFPYLNVPKNKIELRVLGCLHKLIEVEAAACLILLQC